MHYLLKSKNRDKLYSSTWKRELSKMQGIIQYSHELLTNSIQQGEIAIDATCGNGNDTLVLSDLVGKTGRVLAFDIQKQAITNTEQLLKQHGKTNVKLIHDGHEHIGKYLHNKEEIGGAIFNLGYLPKSDKKIITKGETTITALETILQSLKQNGLVVLVVYHGHDGGENEKKMLLEYVRQLQQKKYHVLKYEFINLINKPPFIIAIEKIS